MRFPRFACVLSFVCLLTAPSVFAEWGGEILTFEGVTTVVNPESPADGEVSVELRELWRVGGDDEDVMFGVISQFLHDDAANIYLLDGQLSEVLVFSPDGELLRTLGRAGEGPGEFTGGTDMFWAPGGDIGVVQIFPGKIVLLTREGDPSGTFSMPFRDGAGFQVAARAVGQDGRIILAGSTSSMEDGKQMSLAYLKAYDMDGNELAHFHEEAREQRYGGWEFREETFSDFQRRWAAAPDGRVAAFLSFADYRIHVWNADGSLDRIIERPSYPLVERTGQEKKRFQAFYDRITSWNPGSTFVVNEHHQTLTQMFFRDDGTLWVRSSRDTWRAGEGAFTAFDVFDREGHYVKRVQLQADAHPVEDGLFFVGDRAYVVTDLFSAMMSSVGGDETENADMEMEPVSVIAFEVELGAF